MPATPPIAVTDRKAAAMLDLPKDEFRRLVQEGVLPQPMNLGDRERWDVETLRAIVRGDTSKPTEGLEL